MRTALILLSDYIRITPPLVSSFQRHLCETDVQEVPGASFATKKVHKIVTPPEIQHGVIFFLFVIMTLSMISSSFSFPHQGNNNVHDIIDNDIDALLDIEEIFNSVFSPCFEDESSDIRSMTMQDFGLPPQTPNVMPSMSSSGLYATPVSPTSSCVELANVSTNAYLDHATSDLCEPTPLADMMGSPATIHSNTEVMNQQGKKRSSSTVSKAKSPRPAKKQRGQTPLSKVSSSHDENSQDDVLEQTRERNREHARKSRLRKKELTSNLVQSLEELKAENEKLRSSVMRAFGSSKTESLILERKSADPNENFINALKQPNNRIVDNDALSFLAKLRKEALVVMGKTITMEETTKDEKLDEFQAFHVIG